MAMNPYQFGQNKYNPEEFNPKGDSFNGKSGSMTPNSVLNQKAQPSGGNGGNAFESMINHAVQFNQAVAPQIQQNYAPQAQPPSAPPSNGHAEPWGPQPIGPPILNGPYRVPDNGLGWGGPIGQPPSAPPQGGNQWSSWSGNPPLDPERMQPQPPYNYRNVQTDPNGMTSANAIGYLGPAPQAPSNGYTSSFMAARTDDGGLRNPEGTEPPIGTTPPPPPPPPPGTPTGTPTIPDNLNKPLKDPDLNKPTEKPQPAVSRDTGFLQAWAKVPGYEWLATHERGVDMVRGYLAFLDQNGLAGENGLGEGTNFVDFPDWLAAQPGSAQSQYGVYDPWNAVPLVGRNGRNTYYDWKNKDGQPLGTGTSVPQTPITPPPSTPSTPTGATPPTAPQTAPPPPKPQGAPTGAPTGTTATPTTPTAPTPTATPTAPEDTIKKLMEQYASSYSSGGNNPMPTFESKAEDYGKYFKPMFGQQQEDMTRKMRAEAAKTGAINSGGYLESTGRALSDLTAKQGAQLGGLQFEANEASKEREMKSYLANLESNTKLKQTATEAGMQRYIADLEAGLKREGYDLQKWMASEDNALKKYGIDMNVFVEKLQAETGLSVAQIQAGAQVSAASIHAAASQAAAAANAQASREEAYLRYQLGQDQLSVGREQNIGNFILGMLGLQGDNIDRIIGTDPSKLLDGNIPWGDVLGQLFGGR